jgi:non-canonical purine NTP pyrophosphatase (RdgB/HAM1 family)
MSEHGGLRSLLEGVVLVSGNPNKVEEARRICGFDLDSEPLDLPEIQHLDLDAVLRAKGEEAWRRLRRPLIVEETGLELAALNGFPGPLVKWMLQAVGAEGISRTANALGNSRVAAVCGLHYRDDRRFVFAEGRAVGELVLPARGEGGFGWDPVFRPETEQHTYAELDPERKDAIGHRGRAWRALLEKLRGGARQPIP